MGENYALYPVHYINQIEKLDGMTNNSAIFHYWLTRKSACWSYENDIRAIGRNLPDKVKFDPEMLREIVFGCKVKDGSISALIKHVKKEFKWIRFKNAD